MAIAFTLTGLLVELNLEALFLLFYSTCLTVVFIIDLEEELVLDVIFLAAFPVDLSAAVVSAGGESLVEALLAGALRGGIFLAIDLFAQGGIDTGDAKFAGVIGLIIGIPGVAVAFFVAVLSGGAVALALLALRRKGRKDHVPFGTFLVLGTALALLAGEELFS